MKPSARSLSETLGIAVTGLVVGLWGCGPGLPGETGGSSTAGGGTTGAGGAAGSAGSGGGAGGVTSAGGSGGSKPGGGSGGASTGGSGGVLNTGGSGGSTGTGSGEGGSGGSTGTGSGEGGSGGATSSGSGGATGTTTSTTTLTLTLTGTETGSGPGIIDPPPVSSGSRLRARLLDGGDGAVAFAGWRDTQLDQPCSFQNDEDGTLRCIPDADPRAVIRYLDSHCTQPVIARSCASQAAYVSVKSGPAGCEPSSEPHTVYQAGAALNPPVTYALLGGSCVVKLPDPTVQIREADPVLPDTFVAATIETELHGNRLTLEVISGDDGSRETRRIRDAQVSVSCSPEWTAPGRRGCLPTSDLLGSLFYADAQCASPLLVRMQNGAACPAPSYGLSRGGDACTDVATAVSVGAAVTPQSLFQGNGQACMPTPVVPNFWAFYAQGADVQSSTFMDLLRQEAGTSRLRVPVDTSTDGIPVLPPTAFRDSQRGLDCNVKTFADGSLRCVPINVATVKFYRDPQCTVPVVTLVQDPVCNVPPSTEMIASAPPSAPGCSTDVVQKVYSIGAAYNGLSIYRKTSGNGCASLSASSVDAYDLGPEISADAFSLVVEQIQ